MKYFKSIFLIPSITFVFISCSIDFSVASWKDGEIKYYLKGDFTSSEVSDLELAMTAWETVSRVDFIEVSPKSSAYEIRKVYNTGWSSTIGENNVKCYMNFKGNDSGVIYSHILHELGHCLGLYHEHQRPDRDNFINIYFENIRISEYEEFETKDNPLYEESDFDYDYNSIMHYPEYAFSINGFKTIESCTSTDVSRLGIITEIDAKKIQEIYGSPIDKEKAENFLINQSVQFLSNYEFFEE